MVLTWFRLWCKFEHDFRWRVYVSYCIRSVGTLNSLFKNILNISELIGRRLVVVVCAVSPVRTFNTTEVLIEPFTFARLAKVPSMHDEGRPL